MLEAMYNFMTNEHANLVQNYHNVCLIIKDLSEVIRNLETKIQLIERNKEAKNEKVLKKCKYFNTGFCKSRGKCLFLHPESICEDYLDSGKCDNFRTCQRRHPKICRYWVKSGECFQSCAYLHKTIEHVSVEKDDIQVSTDEVVSDENAEETRFNHEETVNEMTVEDIIKFYEDEKNLYTSEDVENYCDIGCAEGIVDPHDNVKAKPKIIKAQKIVPRKSTKKKYARKLAK